MEPRARAGKNVGKMNFGYGELRQLLYGSGDSREPLTESMRLLDEIATDFIQGLSFEAARIAHYAGRQKIKYEDFEFALRRNPLFLGKVREMFEMSKEVKDARKMPGIGEGNLGKADVNELAKMGEDTAPAPASTPAPDAAAAFTTPDTLSSAASTGQKRKYNRTGESKKKKKAKIGAPITPTAALITPASTLTTPDPVAPVIPAAPTKAPAEAPTKAPHRPTKAPPVKDSTKIRAKAPTPTPAPAPAPVEAVLPLPNIPLPNTDGVDDDYYDDDGLFSDNFYEEVKAEYYRRTNSVADMDIKAER